MISGSTGIGRGAGRVFKAGSAEAASARPLASVLIVRNGARPPVSPEAEPPLSPEGALQGRDWWTLDFAGILGDPSGTSNPEPPPVTPQVRRALRAYTVVMSLSERSSRCVDTRA